MMSISPVGKISMSPITRGIGISDTVHLGAAAVTTIRAQVCNAMAKFRFWKAPSGAPPQIMISATVNPLAADKGSMTEDPEDG
jgi:hypothetical protein